MHYKYATTRDSNYDSKLQGCQVNPPEGEGWEFVALAGASEEDGCSTAIILWRQSSEPKTPITRW